MATSNLSAVAFGKNDLRMVQRPIEKPADDQVLIRISKVGICGTDISLLTKGKFAHMYLKEPMVIGHECAGTVVECGSKVKHLSVGDRVCIETAVPCHTCFQCKRGRYELCPNMKASLVPPYQGMLSEYYTFFADYCFKIPDNISMEEGAFVEPLSVGIWACRRAGISMGSTVLICGAGTMGMVCLICAKIMGASKVCVTELPERKKRIQAAKDYGADAVLEVDSDDVEALAKRVVELLGKMPDITMECSGAESSTRMAIHATESGGVVALVGIGPPEMMIPTGIAIYREIDIRPIIRYNDCFPLAIELISSGKVDVKPLITHRFELKDSKKAFDTAIADGDAFKVMVSCE